jgi:hypothetical protein
MSPEDRATQLHPPGVAVAPPGGRTGEPAGVAPAGPIGMLLGGALGTVAGGLGGRRAEDLLDPAVEADYWRQAHLARPYVESRYSFDTDYLPAYRFGAERRAESVPPPWDDALEVVLHEEWLHRRANSALTWAQARAVVRDAWDRADRSYRAYRAVDRYYEARFELAAHREPGYAYGDYRPAYRYGTWARAAEPARDWDEALEDELERGWQRAKGSSRLSWERARAAVQEAWRLAAQATADGAGDGLAHGHNGSGTGEVDGRADGDGR